MYYHQQVTRTTHIVCTSAKSLNNLVYNVFLTIHPYETTSTCVTINVCSQNESENDISRLGQVVLKYFCFRNTLYL